MGIRGRGTGKIVLILNVVYLSVGFYKELFHVTDELTLIFVIGCSLIILRRYMF